MSASKIRIYKGLATEISSQSKMLKTVSAYLVLKSKVKSSVILNLGESASYLAGELMCSEKTLYTRINEMLRLKLATKYGTRVTLCSYENFKSQFGITTLNTHYVKAIPCKLEYVIKALAIKENFSKQEHKIKKRHDSEKGCGLTLEAFVSAEKQRFIDAFVNNKLVSKTFNPFVTIGQVKLTDLLRSVRKDDRKKTNSGGHYWTHRLSGLNLLTSKQRTIESHANARSTPLGFVFWNGKKQVCKMRNDLNFSF